MDTIPRFCSVILPDHRQQRHFFLPEWDEEYLICGTEPGTVLEEPEKPTFQRKLHYSMIFPDKTGFQKVMESMLSSSKD